MAALVNDGVHGGNQTIFVIMGGDTDILVIELGGIRMLRFRNSTVAPVHAQNLHQIIRELSLDFHRIVLKEETIFNGFRLLDLGDERYDDLPQLRKKRIQGLHGQSLFVFIQQGIVRCQVRIVVAGKLPVEIHQLFQKRRKGRKIILIFRLLPGHLGIVLEHGILHIFLSGDPVDLVIFLSQNFHFPDRLPIQFFLVLLQIGQQCFILRVCNEVIGNLGHDLHGLTTAFPAVTGGNGGGIQIHNTQSMIVGRPGPLELLQLLQSLMNRFKSHKTSPFLSDPYHITPIIVRQLKKRGLHNGHKCVSILKIC